MDGMSAEAYRAWLRQDAREACKPRPKRPSFKSDNARPNLHGSSRHRYGCSCHDCG